MLSILFILNISVISIPKDEDFKDTAIANSEYMEISTRRQMVSSSINGTDYYSSSFSDYTDFQTSYFDNLTYNFGVNYKGSCGYVAIAMLLSYYDTYYSDNVIAEGYDIVSNGSSYNMVERRNSPGVLKDMYSTSNNTDDGFGLTAAEYYNFVSSMANVSLHSKLITIGASQGYYDFSDNNNPAGTNFNSRKQVITAYLNTRGLSYSLDYRNYDDANTSSQDVRNYTINKIKAGIPVLLSVGGARGGHVVVAYDYDSANDLIYCHMGWNANTTHCTIESYGYNIYKTALTINFNGSHSHSNNYRVTTVTNNVPHSVNYCYDSPSIYTYNPHPYHSYYRHYSYYSNTQHKAYCECGEYILKNHEYNGVWVSGNQVKGTCTKCQTTCIIRTLSSLERQLYSSNLLNLNVFIN